MTRLLRSGPAITRSMASSSSDIPMVFLLRRAARMAPSLIRLARSAPEKPGVTLARVASSTVLSNGLPLAWTSRIALRPLMSSAGFTCDGAAQQRLASARRADKQHAFGNARAERGKLLRVLQEFDDFLKFLFGLLNAGDVLERDRRLVAHEHARSTLAEAQRLIV